METHLRATKTTQKEQDGFRDVAHVWQNRGPMKRKATQAGGEFQTAAWHFLTSGEILRLRL